MDIDLEVVKEKILDTDAHHGRTLDVGAFKSWCFKVQAGMDIPTPEMLYKSYNITNTTESIYVSAPGEEAPAYFWWCPY